MTRRCHILTLALLLLVLPCRGAAGPVQRFGFLAGATSTNRSFTGDASWDLNTAQVWGWLLGANVQWSTPVEPLSLTTEFLLLEKGYSRQLGSETLTADDQYLSLPFLATYYFMRHPANPHLFAGPSIEILMEGSEEYGRSNLGLHVGGGIRLGNFEVDARYTHDLTDATGTSPAGPRTVTNYGLLLTLGVGIEGATRATSTP